MTAIEWTHRPGTVGRTWNPTKGCSRKSEGCRHCYAEQQAARIVRMGKGKPTPYDGLVKLVNGEARWTGVVNLVPEVLAQPLKWRQPSTVFVNSMSDLFHESLTNEQIAAVFGVMAACQDHTFLILTKRAERLPKWYGWLRGPSEDTFTMQQRGIVSAPNTARALLDAAYEYLGKARKPELDAAWKRLEDDPWPLPNVWIGVSVENQDAADERIPELLRAPAAVRFLSCEPLLGPVDLRHVQHEGTFEVDALTGDHGVTRPLAGRGPRVDWVIAGCESGSSARPCDVTWLSSLRDQCTAAGVPYFLKQATGIDDCGPDEDPREVGYGHGYARPSTVIAGPGSHRKPGGVIGAPYLDGHQHLEFPK